MFETDDDIKVINQHHSEVKKREEEIKDHVECEFDNFVNVWKDLTEKTDHRRFVCNVLKKRYEVKEKYFERFVINELKPFHKPKQILELKWDINWEWWHSRYDPKWNGTRKRPRHIASKIEGYDPNMNHVYEEIFRNLQAFYKEAVKKVIEDTTVKNAVKELSLDVNVE